MIFFNVFIIGTEFFYPLISFYCDLCSKFLPTNQQGQDHLRSERHLVLYQVSLSSNESNALSNVISLSFIEIHEKECGFL